ncbi:hypothetical protein BRC2024_HCTLARHO_CDS_0049 [Acinetobacter phage vB_AbaS_Silvergun]
MLHRILVRVRFNSRFVGERSAPVSRIPAKSSSRRSWLDETTAAPRASCSLRASPQRDLGE